MALRLLPLRAQSGRPAGVSERRSPVGSVGWRQRLRLQTTRSRLAAGAFVAYLAIYALWQLIHFGPADQQQLLSNVFFFPIDAAAILACWQASRRSLASPRLRRSWQVLAVAVSCQFLGDLVYTAYELAGASAYPSVADAFYLSFYPFVLVALLRLPVARLHAGARMRMWVDLALTSLGGAAAFSYVVLGPTALADNGNTLQSIFTVAYPVGDLVLLVGLAALLLRGSAPSARRSLSLITTGLAFFVTADLIYGYQTLHAGYVDGSWLDALWFSAIVLFAVAGLAQGPVDGPELIAPSRERISWLPYAAVAGGFGLLIFANRHDHLFPSLLMALVAITLAGLVSIRQFLTQRDALRAQARIAFQAVHDGLTLLPNRTLLLERLAQVLDRRKRLGTHVAVLLLDVDDFKLINDTLGHAAGDELLVALATRLTAVTRAGETVGRLGGDEFCLVAEGEFADGQESALAERVLAVFAEPFTIHDQHRTLSGSVGIALSNGGATRPEDLVRDADTAMYRAKESGKNRHDLFDDDLRSELLRHVALSEALGRTLQAGRLTLEFQPICVQPIVDASDGSVLAVEALARWTEDTFGSVPPAEFIPLAEKNGLIVPLGRAVLDQACAELARRRAIDPTDLPLGIFVNCSPRELHEPDYCAVVLETLAAHDLQPGDLAIELTERVFIDEHDRQTGASLDELTASGVRLVLDDFGTGYSALASLKRFPLAALKIDRFFIQSIERTHDEAPVTRSIVALGQALGMLVIAEGVESEFQLSFLRSIGCEAVQGYLTGRPEPAGGQAGATSFGKARAQAERLFA